MGRPLWQHITRSVSRTGLHQVSTFVTTLHYLFATMSGAVSPQANQIMLAFAHLIEEIFMLLCPNCKKPVYMNSDNYCGNCGSPLGDVTGPTLVGLTFQGATIPLEAAVRSNQPLLPLDGQAGNWLLTALLVFVIVVAAVVLINMLRTTHAVSYQGALFIGIFLS